MASWASSGNLAPFTKSHKLSESSPIIINNIKINKSAWGVVAFAGGKFYIAAMKNRLHVGFAINGLSREEIDFFEGSGKTIIPYI